MPDIPWPLLEQHALLYLQNLGVKKPAQRRLGRCLTELSGFCYIGHSHIPLAKNDEYVVKKGVGIVP